MFRFINLRLCGFLDALALPPSTRNHKLRIRSVMLDRESLLKADRGGAVAVWASSGMSVPNGQAAINQELYRLIFAPAGQSLRLGEATRRAKAAVGDTDISRSWILFGDPTMRLK